MKKRAPVVWFTGLPGSGKTTVSRALAEHLRSFDQQVEVLDGDVVRTTLSKGLGFSRADRDENIARIAFVADLLSRNGVTVVVAAITPYQEARDRARALIGRIVEVYVATPLEVCAERDTKGLYERARAGEVQFFTGVSDPYEVPSSPEVTVDTSRDSVEDCVLRIRKHLG